jgi:hypothetical protein
MEVRSQAGGMKEVSLLHSRRCHGLEIRLSSTSSHVLLQRHLSPPKSLGFLSPFDGCGWLDLPIDFLLFHLSDPGGLIRVNGLELDSLIQFIASE